MKRIMLVLSLAAMFMVAAAPAIAQSFFVVEDDVDDFGNFDFDNIESGDIEAEVDIFNTGNNVNLCTTVVQSANTGNIQNAQGVTQLGGDNNGFVVDDNDFVLDFNDGDVDDIEFEGSEIVIAPEASTQCVQSIEQTAIAFGW